MASFLTANQEIKFQGWQKLSFEFAKGWHLGVAKTQFRVCKGMVFGRGKNSVLSLQRDGVAQCTKMTASLRTQMKDIGSYTL